MDGAGLAQRALPESEAPQRHGDGQAADHPDPGRAFCRRLAAVRSNRIYLWDVDSGKNETQIEIDWKREVQLLALDSGGIRVAAVVGDEAWVWDVASKQRLHVITDLNVGLNRIQFTTDGRRLICHSVINRDGSSGNRLTVWDFAQKRVLFQRLATGYISLTDSPDGRLIAWGNDRRIELIDGETGLHRATLFGHTKPIRHLTFSPDGDRLYSASRDGTLRTWDVRAWKNR